MLKRMLLLLSSHVPRENHYIKICLYDMNFASRKRKIEKEKSPFERYKRYAPPCLRVLASLINYLLLSLLLSTKGLKEFTI